MKITERRPGEGRLEHLARLGVVKSLGLGALIAAGVVLAPPVAAPLAAAAAIEGVSALGFRAAQQHLKNKRLRSPRR